MLKTFGYARQAVTQWTARQILVAALAAVVVGLLIGAATVLIPNPLFARDIPPVWWNYPVWIITSIVSGMLLATYIQPNTAGAGDNAEVLDPKGRYGKLGMVGGFLSWFAVGCPVCNKIALLALGYTGALTFFAPLQPVLAILALVFTCLALVWRLQGLAVCPMPARPGSGGEPR